MNSPQITALEVVTPVAASPPTYTRDVVYEKLNTPGGAEEFIVEAAERRTTLGHVLQEKAPDRGASYSHPIATRDFLARDNLRLRAQGRRASSPLGDFKKPYQKALLGDHYDDVFQRSFSGDTGYRDYVYASHEDAELAEKLELRESGMALTAFQAHTPFRPRTTADLEYDMYMAEVPYADLVRDVDVIDGIDTQIPVVEVPKNELLMQETYEGQDPPRVTIGHKTKQATLYRYAITISITDMIANSRNSTLVSAIEREVIWIGVRYDEMFSHMLAKRIMAMAQANAGGAGSQLPATLDAEGVLTMQSSFSDGRTADRVIGVKGPILKYIAALASVFGSTATSGGARGNIGFADGQGSEAMRLIAQPVLGNRISRPERAYYFTNTAAILRQPDVSGQNDGAGGSVTALPERSAPTDIGDELFWYDSMRTLTRLEYVGGIYDQMSMDAPKALHERTLARWLGYYEKEDPPVVSYDVS